jgi:hypothetical protein
MKAPKDQRQLELFRDPKREWAQKVVEALIEHGDKINYLHDLAKKVLAGEPGYARPEHVRRMRQRRRVLSLGKTASSRVVRYRPLRSAKTHVCWAYTCNRLATGHDQTEVSK